MKKLLTICLVLLPLSVYAEIGLKVGVNQLSFKNSGIETKTDYSVGLHYAKNRNKKFHFSFELLFSKFNAFIKNAPVCKYVEMTSTFPLTFEDIDIDFSYLNLSLFMNYRITLPFFNNSINIYAGPTLSINTRTVASTKFIKQIIISEYEPSKCKYVYHNDDPDLYGITNCGWFYNLGFVVTRGIFDISARYAITFNEIDAPNIALDEQMSHVIYAFLGVHFN